MLKLFRIPAALAMVALMSIMLGGTGAKAAPTAQSTLPAAVLQTEWTLQYFSSDAKNAGQDVSSSHITIKFEADGTLGGSGGCNSYFGTYTVSGQKMTIPDKLGSTQKACDESVMNQESLYFGFCLPSMAYALKGYSDLIYADSATAMTFIPSGSQGGQGGGSALSAEILQTEWVLRYFNSNVRGSEDVATAGISIKFAADGTLDGYAGCNNYFGSYTVSGQQLTIAENLGTTRMACPPAQTTLEGRYLMLLPTVKSYTATATELQLVYGNDGAALVYIPWAMTPQVEPPVQTGMPNTGGGTPTDNAPAADGFARGSECWGRLEEERTCRGQGAEAVELSYQ